MSKNSKKKNMHIGTWHLNTSCRLDDNVTYERIPEDVVVDED
jgi:hypothetical protein